MGVVKTFNGIARASLKTWDGIAAASVKTINGLDATTSGGTVIVGYDTAGGTTTAMSQNYMFAVAKFTASQTGEITSFDHYSSRSSATAMGINLALYADNAGSPDALLDSQEFASNTDTWSAGWHSYAISPGWSVTNGSTYWLCLLFSNNLITGYYNTGGTNTQKFKIRTYASGWLDPFGAATSNGTLHSVRATLTY